MTRTHVEAEIASQPSRWREAASMLPEVAGLLPRFGERVAVAGCGTSWFMAMAYGGLAGAGDLLLRPLRSAIERRTPIEVDVRPAALGTHAGCTGAGLLALDLLEAG
ncbi:MAG: hypothetical protein ACRDPS_05115 [Nocardioides sp.]|uniref:hypothetical protein n=1 Tax=Nocardioides sp. TaxID=35761 RepID=UPI003D6BE848